MNQASSTPREHEGRLLYSVDEFAARCGVSRKAAYRWLPHVPHIRMANESSSRPNSSTSG